LDCAVFLRYCPIVEMYARRILDGGPQPKAKAPEEGALQTLRIYRGPSLLFAPWR